MPKLPRPTGPQMVRFLEAQGFAVVRIRGSHHIMARGTARTTVPVHGNQMLKIGTLRGILREIDLSPNEFERLWMQ
ncbi:MAG: type II toxin-antitoxin system HicA family toxin [Acidobacteria bacterium]|nr:type II toxin-antitoxin system HicA family toxin [Acidobacteriota bacterium]